MTQQSDITPDQIKVAVGRIRDLRPVYGPLLDFYEKLFLAQEDSKKQISLTPIEIAPDVLSIKIEEGFPLISVRDFAIDFKSATSLLQSICRISINDNGGYKETATALLIAIEKDQLDVKRLFSSILDGDASFINELSETDKIDKNVLGVMTYYSIQPALNLSAEQLSTYLDPDNPIEKGYCPICGSFPGLSTLEGEGQRFQYCHFCWLKWPSKRLCCPFCENQDSRSLHYFYSESEIGYRVDVCDKCKKYIKTIDLRKIRHPLYPPLEQVTTLHLDMKAKEMDLESGIPLEFATE
jgi:FdhE protein